MPDEINGKLDELIGKVDNIETLLVGDVKDTKKLGLLERIRNVEKWIEKREWFEKVLIVATIGNLIGLIFMLVKASF